MQTYNVLLIYCCMLDDYGLNSEKQKLYIHHWMSIYREKVFFLLILKKIHDSILILFLPRLEEMLCFIK